MWYVNVFKRHNIINRFRLSDAYMRKRTGISFVTLESWLREFLLRKCIVKCLPFCPVLNALTRVTHICVGDLTIIASDNGLPPGRCQAIIQCWNIVKLTLSNKVQWNVNRNSFIFIQDNAFEKCRLRNGGHSVLSILRDEWASRLDTRSGRKHRFFSIGLIKYDFSRPWMCFQRTT